MVAAAAVLGYRPDVPSALPAPRRVLVQDKTIPRRFRSIVFLFAGHPGARFAVYERPRSQPFEPAVQRTQFDAPACQYADAGTFPDGRPWVRVVSTVHVTVMWSTIHGLQAILTASADQLTPEAALAKARLAEQ